MLNPNPEPGPFQGATFLIVFGRWGGIGVSREPLIHAQGTAWRLVLGWVAFQFLTFDLELYFHMVSHHLNAVTQERDRLRKRVQTLEEGGGRE